MSRVKNELRIELAAVVERPRAVCTRRKREGLTAAKKTTSLILAPLYDADDEYI